ncbi:serine/threonine-protein phosphatase 1 regulatory subunit 10-like [Desmodus rotundus]|uniref:serine/threonine-protein phosphatase 1 regulatory subunit 10-like n=1 Tax=Desmodus rotundus TaxID=9430 RepID=UPI0039E6FCCF
MQAGVQGVGSQDGCSWTAVPIKQGPFSAGPQAGSTRVRRRESRYKGRGSGECRTRGPGTGVAVRGRGGGGGHSLCVACVPGQRAAPRWAAHGSGFRAARGVRCAGAGDRAAQEAGPPVGHGAGARPGGPRRGERTSRQEAAPEPAGGHGAEAGDCPQRAGWESCTGHHPTAGPLGGSAPRGGADRGGAMTPPNPSLAAECVRARPGAVGLVQPHTNRPPGLPGDSGTEHRPFSMCDCMEHSGTCPASENIGTQHGHFMAGIVHFWIRCQKNNSYFWSRDWRFCTLTSSRMMLCCWAAGHPIRLRTGKF